MGRPQTLRWKGQTPDKGPAKLDKFQLVLGASDCLREYVQDSQATPEMFVFVTSNFSHRKNAKTPKRDSVGHYSKTEGYFAGKGKTPDVSSEAWKV